MSEQTAAPVSVTVIGDPDAELFVINHALQLVARSPLPWSGTLAPGVYKFKYRRGTAIREESVVLQPGAPAVSISAPRLETVSPAPLEASSRTHEYHIKAAVDHSKTAHLTFGDGGQLFLLVRDWTHDKDPVRTTHPAAGLQLCNWSGKLLVDIEAAANKGGQGAEDRWAAINVGLSPGNYLLRLTTNDRGTFEQTMVVSRGWQTQVFLLITNYGSADRPDWRGDVSRASVLMSELGRGFDPGAEEFKLTDTACAWLGARQQTTAGEALKRALGLKFNNPMLGIYAAHALVGGRTKSAAASAPEFDGHMFETVVSHLESLVGGHPDVLALRLWLDDAAKTSAPPLAIPPMLTSSWSVFVAASAKNPALIAHRSLASRIGASLWGGGPWLIWMRDELGGDEETGDLDVWAALQSMRQSLSSASQLDLSDLQRALLQHAEAPRASRAKEVEEKFKISMPEPVRSRSTEQLVQSLGVPLETLRGATADLLKKVSIKFKPDDK